MNHIDALDVLLLANHQASRGNESHSLSEYLPFALYPAMAMYENETSIFLPSSILPNLRTKSQETNFANCTLYCGSHFQPSWPCIRWATAHASQAGCPQMTRMSLVYGSRLCWFQIFVSVQHGRSLVAEEPYMGAVPT